jgi:branched-chain amino acid transport system permease protein
MFTSYLVAGISIGFIYAIGAVGLAGTFRATGVLNLAFGGIAYFIARFYYFLNTQHTVSIVPSFFISVLLAGPALGLILYLCLFRWLLLSPPLVKVVATLGLSVMLPPLAALLFGVPAIISVPGLAPQPVGVLDILGVPINYNQVIVCASLLVIFVGGGSFLQFSHTGVKIRAVIDSPAVASLSGISPRKVSVAVWATGTTLSGLLGVLAAPTIGLSSDDFTLLMVASLAAVVVGRLRRVQVAVAAALLMGVLTTVLQRYVPPDTQFALALVASVPCILIIVSLAIFGLMRKGQLGETERIGGPLDGAIAVKRLTFGAGREGSMLSRSRSRISLRSCLAGITPLLIVALVTYALNQFWDGLIGAGLAYAVIFLAFSVVVGEGGMMWLCIPTFAGLGALVAAYLAHNSVPGLLAILLVALLMVPLGAAVGALTARVSGLYLAIVTLSVALLVETVIFSQPVFYNSGIGQYMAPPSFAINGRSFAIFTLLVFAILAAAISNLRRSAAGIAFAAMRSSEAATRTVGLSVFQLKVVLCAIAAFVAAVGGGLQAMSGTVALPANFSTLEGVTWLAIVVTLGVRSNTAALFAGLSFAVIPGLVLTYLPQWFGNIPPILFGLGAVFIALNPEGVVTMHRRQIEGLWRALTRREDGSLEGHVESSEVKVLR